MRTRFSYRFGLDWESGASVPAKSVEVLEDSGSPLAWHVNSFPQRRPNGKDLFDQAAGYRLGRPMKIIIHGKKPVGLELPENPPQLLLDSVDGMEKISPVQVEFLAAQLPVGAKEKVIPEDPMLELR